MHSISLALGLVALLAGDLAATSDWPRWRGPNGDGISPERGWSSRGAAEPLWTGSVGRGYSAPTIANGRLYTLGFHETELSPGQKATNEAPEEQSAESAPKPEVTGFDVTVCLDARTGETLWTHRSPARLWDNMHKGGTLTTPVVDDDTVYVLSRMGPIFALDAVSGAVRWERDLPADFGVELGFFGLSSSPLVGSDVVYLNVGKTVALDKQTGETRWESRDYGYSYATPVPFEWNDRAMLAVFNATGLTVLERDTGDEVATHEWTSNYNVNCATPIVIDDRILISTGYDEKGAALLQLTEDGLELEWATRRLNSKMNGCVHYEGAFYGFDGGKLKCIDVDGEELWMERGLGIGSLIASDGRLIVLSEEGELLVAPISQDGFEPVHRARVIEGEAPCWTTPVLAHGLIYCRDGAGTLVCVDHRAD